MSLHFLNLFANNLVVHAIFKTLAHSVWQGFILAAVAGIVLTATKKSTTTIRYRLLTSLLVGFIVTLFATFYYEIGMAFNNASTNQLNAETVSHQSTFTTFNYNQNILDKIIVFFTNNENILVLLWGLIIFLKSVKVLSGLRNLRRLKTRQIFDAGKYWNEKLNALCSTLKVSKPVKLLGSAIAEIPMVIGHFKPIILFPAAAFTQLSTEQIEAILLHELAHIRRKDYLVNLLQVFAEVLFFFNPAVLWVSNLIKDERENCCDDIAIAQVKNKRQFINALISFQEHNLAPKYAASFSGRKNHLLNRVKRILTNNNKTLNNMEKILLASGILFTCFIAVAFTQKNQTSVLTATSEQKISTVDTTLPSIIKDKNSEFITSEEINGKHYKLIETDGKVIELYADDNKIPAEKLDDYEQVITELKKKIAQQMDEAKVQAQKMVKQAEVTQLNHKLNEQKAEEISKQAELINKQALAMADDVKKEIQPLSEEMEKQAVIMNAKAKEIQDKVEKEIQPELEEYEKQAKIYADQAKIVNDKIIKEVKPQQEEYEKQAELYKQKAIEMKEKIEKSIKPQQKVMAKQLELMKQKALEVQKNPEPGEAELKKQIEILQKEYLEQQPEMKKDVNSDSTHI